MSEELILGIVGAFIAAAFGIWRVVEWRTRRKLDQITASHAEKKAICDSVKVFIANVVTNASVDNNALQRLMRDTRDAKLYFKEDVISFIWGLYSRGLELEKVQSIYKMCVDGAPQAEITKLVDEEHELLTWFESSFRRADSLFDPYLKLVN